MGDRFMRHGLAWLLVGWLLLPYAACAREPVAEGADGDHDGASRRPLPHRVLVVDDNVDAAASLAELLTLEGSETAVAHDGPAAIARAQSFRPDAIFLDIGLPGMLGYDVCRVIRQQPGGKDMLIVALTGFGKDDDRQAALAAGFDRHLDKPVDPRLLRTILEQPEPETAL